MVRVPGRTRTGRFIKTSLPLFIEASLPRGRLHFWVRLDGGLADEFVEADLFDDVAAIDDEAEVGVFPFIVGAHEVGDGDVLAGGVLAEVADAESVFDFWDAGELRADAVTEVSGRPGLDDVVWDQSVDVELVESAVLDVLDEVGCADRGLFGIELDDDLAETGVERHQGVTAELLEESPVGVEEGDKVEHVVVDRFVGPVIV